jgi:hypothetical protein
MQPRSTPSSYSSAGRPLMRERRTVDRTPISQVTCDAGSIVDLSIRGMRVIALGSWPEGETRPLTLTDGRHRLVLPARCVWQRRESEHSYSLGLAFDHVEPAHEGMLLRFTMEHSSN